MRSFTALIVLVLFSLAAPSAGAADCFELWLAADVDRNGALEPKEDQRGYIAAVERAQGTELPSRALGRDLFLSKCRDGVFSAVIPGPGPEARDPSVAPNTFGYPLPKAAPPDRGKGDITPGIEPLSEEEARARLRENGFNDIRDLTLGPAGIWRGTAYVHGQRLGVAVDPQGDIIGGP